MANEQNIEDLMAAMVAPMEDVFIPPVPPVAPNDARIDRLEADMAEMKNAIRVPTLQTSEIHSMVKTLMSAGLLTATRPRGSGITKIIRDSAGHST